MTGPFGILKLKGIQAVTLICSSFFILWLREGCNRRIFCFEQIPYFDI